MKLLFDEKEIKRRIDKLAEKLNQEYKDKDVAIVYIEKGGKPFFDRLQEKLKFKHTTDSIRVKSYNGSNSGELTWIKKPSKDLRGKECIIIVDDILDTGQTMRRVKEYFKSLGAKDCKVCVAVNKHERRMEDIEPDYYLFDLDSGFVVGFGMDYNEKYRDLPSIYEME